MIGKTPGGSGLGGGVAGRFVSGGTTGGSGSTTMVERRNQSFGLPETPPRSRS